MASITKAVTAVAVMILYEDGSLLLDDEVVEYIGAFASARVRRAESATGSPDLTEPKTSPTIRHLLTHTAGLARRGKAVNELWGGAATVREFAEGIARIPLRHDPGAGYAYGNAYEVLAAVVESASGERFDRFVQKRILDPLRMTDTHFFVPESKRNRLSAMYTRDEEGGLVYFREPGQEESPSKYFSGGGGLRSTILDFYRFAQMLLNEGTLDGVRVLSPKTVRLMTRDHVGEEVPAAWEGDWGWGFGFAVRRRVLDGEVGTAGSYGWNGGTGTWFFVDPKERLVGLIFTQMNPGNPHDLRERFERSVYFAVDESYAESEDG